MGTCKLHTRYRFAQLRPGDQGVYRQIYNKWSQGRSIAMISCPGAGYTTPDGTDVHDIVQAIIDDNPQLFHLETTQFMYRRNGAAVTIGTESIYTPTEYTCLSAKLKRRTTDILHAAQAYPSDGTRLAYLYQFLVDNIAYHRGLPNPRSRCEIHTIVGALLNSACVCDGYARAFQLLCDNAGLHCIIVCGHTQMAEAKEPHAWNIVMLTGQCYHVDVTQASAAAEKSSGCSTQFFLRSDQSFSHNHEWNRHVYPVCASDFTANKPESETILLK